MARGREIRLQSASLVCILTALYGLALLRTAWVNDDAYITLRTIDNLVNGYGLTWNPAERVQAFTHPLWLFLIRLPYSVTRESYFTTIALSVAISVAAFVLVGGRIARGWWASLLGMTILLLSKSYIDYSTSGLENPATHLLLALFLVIYLNDGALPERRRLWLGALLVALATLNRPDTFLLLAPALALVVARSLDVRHRIPLTLLAFLPLIVWELFSTFYYGSPLPNTAYAKLNTGLPTLDLVEQGALYFLNTLDWDPLTIAVLAGGTLVALVRGPAHLRCIAIGVIFYLGYVVLIGGDFMAGRFFSAPLLVCTVLLLENIPAHDIGTKAVIVGCAIVLGFAAATPSFAQGTPCDSPRPRLNGIEDERCFYYQGAGLLQVTRDVARPQHPWAAEGRNWRRAEADMVIEQGAIGYHGYFAGPGVHILDVMGLADPLLARLPMKEDPAWRIGHFEREVPSGYFDSLQSDTNLLTDPDLARYLDKLWIVTRGQLFDPERLRTVWDLNIGKYSAWLDAYVARQSEAMAAPGE